MRVKICINCGCVFDNKQLCDHSCCSEDCCNKHLERLEQRKRDREASRVFKEWTGGLE